MTARTKASLRVLTRPAAYRFKGPGLSIQKQEKAVYPVVNLKHFYEFAFSAWT